MEIPLDNQPVVVKADVARSQFEKLKPEVEDGGG